MAMSSMETVIKLPLQKWNLKLNPDVPIRKSKEHRMVNTRFMRQR